MVPAPADDGVSFYSKTARDFHASYDTDPNRIERMRVWDEILDRYVPGARFAYDIGCGSGVLTCELGRRGVETVGIDGAAGMLVIAERTAAAGGLSNVSFRQQRLPIAETTSFRLADLIVSSSAIEYLQSIPEALHFLCSLLRDGGVAIFSISNRTSISRRMVRIVHRVTGHPRYLRYLRHFMIVEEIRSALETAGLTYLEHAYFGGADRLNRLLGLLLPPRFANNMIIVAARKGTATDRSSSAT
jgi:2-polyprenyl-3-methyl-5-hydroxy-6-metoxy-1,4-benzoquinol methylase